jgi:4-oxalocrotonate tautomerase
MMRIQSKAETGMPLVNIKLVEGPISTEQKSRLISEVTEVVARVLDKNPASTWVMIDEIKGENWGVGGAPLSPRVAQSD